MLAIIIIAGLIALISLYEFFHTRNWQQVTSDDRNDTVFENRNKAYGAFAIRRDYNKHLLLILAGVVGGAGILYATTRNKNYKQPELNKKQYIETIMVLENKKAPEKEEIFETKPQEHQQDEALAESTKFREPEVSDDHQNDLADIPKEGQNSGDEDRKGEGGLNDVDKGDDHPPLPPIDKKDDDDNGEPIIADEPAEFPGGMDKLRPYLRDKINYPQIAIELNLQGKCFTKFVVSKTGEISDVSVERGVPDCKECDKEAVRVIKGMPRWTPGKSKGRPVNSYFHLPVTFKLATN